MIPPGSVQGDERLRLFLGLRLPVDVVERLADWQRRELAVAAARGCRIVPPENLHVTLAFLGSRPAGDLPAVLDVLAAGARAAARGELEPLRYRETRSVGMVVLDDGSGAATRLAEAVQRGLEEHGLYRREERPWLPHVTILRHRERPRLSPPLPQLGRFAPSEAAAFLSRLHPSGARYEVLESYSLGG